MSTLRPSGTPSGRPDVYSEFLGGSPWTAGDLRRALVYLTLGILGIAVAWLGASGTTAWREQLIWTAVGVTAAVIGAGSGVTWLLSGLARVRTAKGEIKRHFRDLAPTPSFRSSEHSYLRNGSAEWVWSRGMTRFHRPGCDLVKGKPVEILTRAECDRRQLRACGMCQP